MTYAQHDIYKDCQSFLINGDNLEQSCIYALAPLCCGTDGWNNRCTDNGIDVDIPMLCCTCTMDLYYNDA